jgi:hypothetical protein
VSPPSRFPSRERWPPDGAAGNPTRKERIMITLFALVLDLVVGRLAQNHNQTLLSP